MNIFIKFNGETITIDVEANDTVAGIKSKIKAEKDIPVEDQRIIYFGKECKDEQTVKDFDLKPPASG